MVRFFMMTLGPSLLTLGKTLQDCGDPERMLAPWSVFEFDVDQSK